MHPIPVIYENGVFRPTVPIALPEATAGSVTVVTQAGVDSSKDDSSLDRLYKLFEKGAQTGIPDLAARHNEHQP